ncbi:MAG: hypothetical protein NTV51_08440 [Verrucomicrobia bacterium]|nr:hypothetical protein [Verrucomicrobiota bacterium]
MRRLQSLFCLLLLAIWLPTTEHCALEAAGLLGETLPDGCAAAPGGNDSCDTVENGAYKPAGTALEIPAPQLFACVYGLWLQQIQRDAARELVPPPGALHERPHDWVSTWQFVQRAAPSPRAPSVFLA